ncbi:MAG TPA: metallopeptidase family protein [Methylomirabilota bacterium]|nr:metallopeptidase family protein [Methylomirabilota bacterium]
MSWPRLVELARAEVARTVAELPDDLRPRAAALPVTYERVPNRAIEADGIEPDTLGLFVGGEFSHANEVPIPAQIILYLENIWDMVEEDEEEFVEEVRITFIHELGHYLGLDEDELDERGLL